MLPSTNQVSTPDSQRADFLTSFVFRWRVSSPGPPSAFFLCPVVNYLVTHARWKDDAGGLKLKRGELVIGRDR